MYTSDYAICTEKGPQTLATEPLVARSAPE
jgi:hypothetical protein